MTREKIDTVIFLDIDGVLMTNFSDYSGEYPRFDVESIIFLNNLYRSIKYDIVLISSWKDAYTIKYMNDLFKSNGIEAEIIDKTDIIEKAYNRCDISLYDIDNKKYKTGRDDEIHKWLSVFNPNHYLILDDFIVSDLELRKHQIKGLNPFMPYGHVSMDNFKDAIKILKMND